jgi:hypothetical protein
MDSITKIRKYGKDYHNSYYHEKRKFKKGVLNEYKKEIPNTYTLMDYEKYIDDLYEKKLLLEFDCNIKVEYDIDDIKEVFKTQQYNLENNEKLIFSDNYIF